MNGLWSLHEAGADATMICRRKQRGDPRRRACVDPKDANSFTTGSTIATLEYEGLNRRLVKAVGYGNANSHEVGDREETYQT